MKGIAVAALLIFVLTSCAAAPERVFLTVPHKLQSANLCVPTSASMVLSFYGEERTPQYLKELAGSRKDFDGTYYDDMVAGLHAIGYKWRVMVFGLDHGGFREGMREIKRDLSDGRPILISTSSPPIGHTMVVCGYDDGAGNICLMDPARSPGMRIMSYNDLEDIWHDDFQHEVRSILITWPK